MAVLVVILRILKAGRMVFTISRPFATWILALSWMWGMHQSDLSYDGIIQVVFGNGFLVYDFGL